MLGKSVVLSLDVPLPPRLGSLDALATKLRLVGARMCDSISAKTDIVVISSSVTAAVVELKIALAGCTNAKVVPLDAFIAQLEKSPTVSTPAVEPAQVVEQAQVDPISDDDDEEEGDEENESLDGDQLVSTAVDALAADTKDGTLWYNTALALSGADTCEAVTVEGEDYSEVDCYVKAVELDPKLSDAWYNLGHSMPGDVKVIVNGDRMSRAQCFAKAIETRRFDDAEAWCNLGDVLLADDGPVSKVMVRGVEYTAEDCALKALKRDTTNHIAWNNLGEALKASGTSAVVQGHSVGAKDCFVRSLELDDTLPEVWENLGRLISESERNGNERVVVTIRGKKHTLKDIRNIWKKLSNDDKV